MDAEFQDRLHRLGWTWSGFDLYGKDTHCVLWATDGKQWVIVTSDLCFDEAREVLIESLREIVP